MLPDIGIMIGFYIIAKMSALIDKTETTIVCVLSAVTIIVAIVGVVDLFLIGAG